MGIDCQLYLEEGELHVTVEGTVTSEEVRAHLRKEQENSELAYRHLIDARNALVRLSPADVRGIVKLFETLSQTSRIGPMAIIVSTDVAYGMMRMLQILVEDVCIVEPFRDFSEAQQWLRAFRPPAANAGGK
jgi:hypothetical protein